MSTASAKPFHSTLSPLWSQFRYWSCGIARGVLVLAFSLYGTAKFAGAQFFTSGGIFDKPVTDLSGIELTWVFFGYSPLYSNFVAIGQFAAALLLLFGRTARLGATVLLPITANIVVVNFGYRIGLDTQIASLILLALNLYLLVWDFPAWKRLFWDETAYDPARPKFMAGRGAIALQGTAFAFIVGGLFWLLSSQSSVGLSPVSGDWLVKSATFDGQRTADPVLGSEWRWISFDQFGRLSVRTNRFTFLGRYTADSEGGRFTVSYDPEPLPPVYPGQNLSDHLTPEQERRYVFQNYPDYKWPVEMTGTYRKDGGNLVIAMPRGTQIIEWVLIPYKRPKF